MPRISNEELLGITDPTRLREALVQLAQSDVPADGALLGEALATNTVLDILDTEEDYQRECTDTRVADVVGTLAERGSPVA